MLNSSRQRQTPTAADLQPRGIVSLRAWRSAFVGVGISRRVEWSFTPAAGSTHQHFQVTPAGHGSSNALIAPEKEWKMWKWKKHPKGCWAIDIHRPRPWIYSQLSPRQSRSESQADHLSQWPVQCCEVADGRLLPMNIQGTACVDNWVPQLQRHPSKILDPLLNRFSVTTNCMGLLAASLVYRLALWKGMSPRQAPWLSCVFSANCNPEKIKILGCWKTLLAADFYCFPFKKTDQIDQQQTNNTPLRSPLICCQVCQFWKPWTMAVA